MSLYVLEQGPAAAPSVVFLHGGGGAGWMWQPQLQAMRDYHCLVPDLPEHGQSLEVGPFSIQDAAERVARLIAERAHGGRAHLVGLSEGAQVGAQLLSMHPDRVDRAVLSSPLVRPLPGYRLLTPGLLAALYRWTVLPLRNNAWWARLNMRFSAGVPDAYFEPFFKNFRTLSPEAFARVLCENMAFRVPAGLARAENATLVVVGKGEYRAMRRSAQELASVMPLARAFEVVHSERMSLARQHNWSLNAPELFNATLRAWLGGQSLPQYLKPVEGHA